jgi:hypothetical protein
MSPGEWKKLFVEKQSVHSVATKLQSSLRGYRQTSLSRADDLDQIVACIEAAMILAREET